MTLAWVLRAGVVARERVTAALDVRDAGFFFFRGLRTEAFRLLVRAVRRGVWRFAEREGFGLRDEDFTDNSPGMTAMMRYYLRSTSRKKCSREAFCCTGFFGGESGACPASHDVR
jgi:hypothetical protein